MQSFYPFSIVYRKMTRLDFIFNVWMYSALQRKSHIGIPFLGIAWPQSQFPYSCVCERFIYSQDRSIYINRSQTHEGGNWDCGRAILLLGIFILNFWHWFFEVYGWVNGMCQIPGAKLNVCVCPLHLNRHQDSSFLPGWKKLRAGSFLYTFPSL